MRVSHFASDKLLVDRVRAGSAEAFEVLFDRHHRQLLAFCRSMLGSAADAEDAVQHTFMAAYADLMRSNRPIALRPWLYTIARHRALTMLRARRERPLAEIPEPEVHHTSALDAREELRGVLADIAGLPEDQRAALILAELGDFSHAEIAGIVGCRPDKVKALIFQARSRLTSGRTARHTPCAEIREQLAVGGVAMRRTWLRQHVRQCVGCREFGEQVQLQRRRLRVLLPMAPGFGLKRWLLGAVWGSGGGGAAAGVTTAAGLGGVAASVIVSVSIAGAGGPPADGVRAGRELAPPTVTAWVRTHASGERPVRAPGSGRRSFGAEKRTALAPSDAGVKESPERRAGETARHEAAPTGTIQSAGRQPGVPTAPRDTPPEEPGGGKPAEPPTGGEPAEPPSAGKPADKPGGGGKPPERPGGKPADTPGGKPPEPPGGGKPTEPPGGGKPTDTPGGKPPEPPGGGKPADTPGGKPTAQPGGGMPADTPGDGGKPEEPPGRPSEPPRAR